MTAAATGHELALDELTEIQDLSAGEPGAFTVERTTLRPDGWLSADISLDCAGVTVGPGGQPLARVEHATVLIPPSFPFTRPAVRVRHDRFAGLPYVLHGRTICLYHSDSDWNPADGMFSVVARLAAWYRRAAAGRLVETGQPLHPPLAYRGLGAADCVVIRPDLPLDFRPAAAIMVGVYPGRADVIEWLRPETLDLDRPEALGRLRSRLEDVARAHEAPAFLGAVTVLDEQLSFEFPDNLPDLVVALAAQQVKPEELMERLAHVWIANLLAAVRRDDVAPLHALLGAPMRGIARSQASETHLEVWQLNPAEAMLPSILTLSGAGDAELAGRLPGARRQARAWLRAAPLAWAYVEEARPRIVTRRDTGRPAQWLLGKSVLVLGCGAIGARIAEHCVRAGVRRLVVADRDLVGPGVLVRQAYEDADIGLPKAIQLADRLAGIRPSQVSVEAEVGDVHGTVLGADAARRKADLIVDATASRGVSARIEWLRRAGPGRWPPVLTIGVGHDCERAVGALALPHASGAGADILHSFADHAFTDEALRDAAEDFFADPGPDGMFQPEIGCSEPTFTGSDPEVAAAAGQVFAWCLRALSDQAAHRPVSPKSLFMARLPGDRERPAHVFLDWPNDLTAEDELSGYQLRIRPRALAGMRAEALATARRHPRSWETGGVLLGHFDDACRVVWVTAADGPPPDSEHGEYRFRLGTEGVSERVTAHRAGSGGRARFIGLWHTHPDTAPRASTIDEDSMRTLLTALPGQAPRRAVRLIIGGKPGEWEHWLQGVRPPEIGFRLLRRSDALAEKEQR
jgi:integrative and conjugative element protein (TIGR02256 family)